MRATAAEVVGREDELRDLAEFLQARETLPAALVLEGEAGIGKTTLWGAGVEVARERDYRVLASRPSGSETQLSFAGLRDLLEDAFAEVAASLSRPQRGALAVALLMEEPGPLPPEPGAIAAAVLTVLRRLAAAKPVLVAIDDVQWLDASSGNAVAFAVRRLRTEPVALLLARRARGGEPLPLELGRAAEELRRTTVRLRPLSLGAVHHLLRARLGLSLHRPALRKLHEASGGNPFFALELGRALVRRGAVSGELPSLPRELREVVRERIAALPPEAREALLVAAALVRPTLEAVEAAAGATSTREALEGGLLEIDAGRVHFSHPLLAAAVLAECDGVERRNLHRRLADLTREPEDRARQLALATDSADEAVAAELETAASDARSHGAIDAAAYLGERALRLTPPELHEAAHRRRIAAAEDLFEAGDIAAASAVLEEGLAELDGPLRARLRLQLAVIRDEAGRIDEAVDLCRKALDEAGRDLALRAEIHTRLARRLSVSLDLDAAAEHAHAAVELAERHGDRAVLAPALATLAMIEFRAGRGLQRAVMERALSLARGGKRLFLDDTPEAIFATQLLAIGELGAARTTFEAMRDSAARQDSASIFSPLFFLSVLELRAGNWELASRYAAQSLELVVQTGREAEEAVALWMNAFVNGLRGAVDEAEAQAADALVVAERTSQRSWMINSRALLGILALSRGDHRAACAQLAPAARDLLRTATLEPGLQWFLPEAIEALVHCGRRDEARKLLDPFEETAHRLDRRWCMATAGRCRGLLHAANSDLGAALAALAEAVEVHEGVPMPFERARTLLVLGQTQRRAKKQRAARESLERALAIFEELGARLWLERARAELRRIPGRRRAAGGLTPTERRVADLVAEGRSNKEVAAALFVTVKTVEANLSRIYAKLGIHSRAELARRFTAGDGDEGV